VTVILAIDTSAYTTSVALMSPQGVLLQDRRRLLPVASGQRGLRQAEALFQHVRHLPAVLESALAQLTGARVVAVAASSAPRPVAHSYMPVFLAGAGVGRAVAASSGIPFWEVSHQEGHIWAALWSLRQEFTSVPGHPILAVHLSGGTTEAVLMQGLGSEHIDRPRLEVVGGTSDISAGQFLDRVGVALGLPFPAGPHLDALARQGNPGRARLAPARPSAGVSFSGPESAAKRAIAAGVAPADVARGVFDCLAESLEIWIAKSATRAGVLDIVLGGGVVCSATLRARLVASRVLSSWRLWFAAPQMSSDSAVGVAAWAAARYSGCPVLALPGR
jgi:N6-L-threonylcarbamoyladenine synthase